MINLNTVKGMSKEQKDTAQMELDKDFLELQIERSILRSKDPYDIWIDGIMLRDLSLQDHVREVFAEQGLSVEFKRHFTQLNRYEGAVSWNLKFSKQSVVS